MIFSLFIGFVLGVAALLFALQNIQTVSLVFMGWEFESSLAVLVLSSVGVGILISILASIPSALSASFRIMGLKKENRQLAETVQAHQEALANAVIVEEVKPVVVDLRN